MHLKRIAPVCILTLALSGVLAGQNQQDPPVLKTRPHAQSQNPQQEQGYPQNQDDSSQRSYSPPPQDYSQVQATREAPQSKHGSVADAVPQGTRFLISLMEPLDTRNVAAGQHFTAVLREDLVTPSGLVIPQGDEVRAHVATFERGYMGARMMLALDELQTPGGWVPLVGTVTGVPGDPSITSRNEGELTKKGPDAKRLLANAAIGAAVGAATGAAAGGGKGALAGAAAGAGVGTTTGFLMQGSDMRLDQGANLEIRLDRDLMVHGR